MGIFKQQRPPPLVNPEFPELPQIFDIGRAGDAERQQKLEEWYYSLRQALEAALDKKVDK